MRVSGQRQAPVALFPRRKDPGTHCTRGCVDPRDGGQRKIILLIVRDIISNVRMDVYVYSSTVREVDGLVLSRISCGVL
jgi:hypothetical protein